MSDQSKPRGGFKKPGESPLLRGLGLKTQEQSHSPDKPTELQNQQLSLFQQFLSNTDDQRDRLSNAIDLWDSVPRYSFSRQAVEKARREDEREDDRPTTKHSLLFQYKGFEGICTITPATVEDLNGREKAFYPGVTEELVEDALRKLAADQRAGFFDKPNFRSGVVFSLYALREELKKRGHARSYQEVRLSLEILSGSISDIKCRDANGKEIRIKSPYLPSVVTVSRLQLKDDPNAKWVVHFHPLVTGSIDKVTYRQFNYDLMMRHRSQLARWLHKQLIVKYTFAELSRPFEMRYSTIKRDSGLLAAYQRERAAIAALETAFADLKEQGILSRYDRGDVTGPRKKLLDVVFTIWPSLDFVREVKAANRRQADGQRMLSVGLTGGPRS